MRGPSLGAGAAADGPQIVILCSSRDPMPPGTTLPSRAVRFPASQLFYSCALVRCADGSAWNTVEMVTRRIAGVGFAAWRRVNGAKWAADGAWVFGRKVSHTEFAELKGEG